MGNCGFRVLGEGGDCSTIKVVTGNGGVLELRPPVTAECVTNGFPGHGVYRTRDLSSQPLVHTEELVAGELYYLRPLNHPRACLPSLAAPYRVSFGHHGLWRRADTAETAAKCSGYGCGDGGRVWKVKLVISPAQLSEILSQESRTGELIESVRTVAKCGSGGASSAASSDQWSLAGSRKGSSEGVA